jgi:hypothetical protein
MRAPVAGTDFDDPADLQVQTDNRGVATPTGLMHRKRTVAEGTGAFDNSVGKVLNIVKNFFVTAIDLTEIKMPDPVADLGQELDRFQLIDFGFGRHQGLAAMRALDMDVDTMGHGYAPFFGGRRRFALR